MATTKATFNLDPATLAALDALAATEGTKTKALSVALRNEHERRVRREATRTWIAQVIEDHGGADPHDEAWAADVIGRLAT